MKFWKSLYNLIEETLPEWRDKFLSYKDLKKQLKLIYPKEDDDEEDGGCKKRLKLTVAGDETVGVMKEVVDFVELLEGEIDKFNEFFMDQEEEYIIKLKVMKDKIAEAKDSGTNLMKLGRELVDFHGEMVLLENYSALNYTGLVKILKKYDKLSGALIRSPFIQKVLREPFYSTDVLNKLIKECVIMHDQLFSLNDHSSPSTSTNVKGHHQDQNLESTTKIKETSLKVPEELADIENMESTYLKLTLSALRVLQEIRSGSSTVMKDKIAEAKDSGTELMKLGRELVDFHGEMVLLENYSALNYTGLVKILKKYDKLSGALIRSPFIQKVLREPFYSTDVLNKLIKECVIMHDRLFSLNDHSAPSTSTNVKEHHQDQNLESTTKNKETSLKVPEELADIENMESTYLKLTLSALPVLQEIRSGSSTVSMFSLLPVQIKDSEVWKKSQVLEQVAK